MAQVFQEYQDIPVLLLLDHQDFPASAAFQVTLAFQVTPDLAVYQDSPDIQEYLVTLAFQDTLDSPVNPGFPASPVFQVTPDSQAFQVTPDSQAFQVTLAFQDSPVNLDSQDSVEHPDFLVVMASSAALLSTTIF